MQTTARNIKFSTLIYILKKKPIFLIIGIAFTFIPLIPILIFTLAFSAFSNDAPEIDYELVDEKGQERNAWVSELKVLRNTTFNGVHPTIISYSYMVNGLDKESKYKVLEEEKIADLEVGSQIQIKEYQGQSFIVGLEAFSVPIHFIWMMMIPLFGLGFIFLGISIYKMNKEKKLYQYGLVSYGRIISMTRKSGVPISGIGNGVVVGYEYETPQGKKVLGKSFTNNKSLLYSKKINETLPIFVSKEKPEESCLVPQWEAIKNKWDIKFD